VKSVRIKGILLGAVLCAAPWLCASDKDKSASATKVVDSGSFGIYIQGTRVGTETFKIEDRGEYSVATAEIRIDDGKSKATQSAEMQLTPQGELRSYTWHSTLPETEESSVEPKDSLLVEHIIPADLKKIDVPHLLPLNTIILDDNFFSQRELLLWRYMRTFCDAQLACRQGTFAVLVPRQHASSNATVELIGPEKVKINGAVRELSKVSISTGEPKKLVVLNGQHDAENGQWLLWVDEQLKIVRMTVTGTNIEIVRD
jgi:hypothetical protein